MRPEFGSDVYKFVDAPVNTAVPNIKKAMIEALTIWEKRIRVTNIKHRLIDVHHLEFEIGYTLVDQDLSDSLLFDFNSGIIEAEANPGKVILQAFYPANPLSRRYGISFIINGADALPAPPVNGFATLDELFSWVTDRWGYYGKWYKLADRIVLEVKNSIKVTTASIAISLKAAFEYIAEFPALAPDEKFSAIFQIAGNDVYPFMPKTFDNAGAVLLWAKVNWSSYGEWELDSIAGHEGAFSTEFDNSFDSTLASIYRLKLYSEYEGVTLQLIKA